MEKGGAQHILGGPPLHLSSLEVEDLVMETKVNWWSRMGLVKQTSKQRALQYRREQDLAAGA